MRSSTVRLCRRHFRVWDTVPLKSVLGGCSESLTANPMAQPGLVAGGSSANRRSDCLCTELFSRTLRVGDEIALLFSRMNIPLSFGPIGYVRSWLTEMLDAATLF